MFGKKVYARQVRRALASVGLSTEHLLRSPGAVTVKKTPKHSPKQNQDHLGTQPWSPRF